MTHEAFRTALKVVAEASTDVQFAPSNAGGAASGRPALPSGGSAVDNSSIKGPVNSTQDVGMHDMAALYLNTNSGATSYGDDEDMEASTTQRAIVGAWMLVKEAAATLAMLVDISPRPSDSTLSSQGQYGVLSISEMSVIGSSLLVALGRLKHMGAIAEVQAALNAVSASLLRFGDQCPALSGLPSAG